MILAHGGTGGAVAEVLFVLAPLLIFWMLSRWAKRRNAAERAGDSGSGDRAEGPEQPGPGVTPVG